MKNLHNTAFSLLEILLASIIFIISIGGIFVTLDAVRAPVADKGSALTAANFAKQALETLRSQVSTDPGAYYYDCSLPGQDPCPDLALSLGQHQVPSGNLPSGLTWPPALLAIPANTVCDASGCLTYTVSCADGSAAPCPNADVAHRVDLNICLDTTC